MHDWAMGDVDEEMITKLVAADECFWASQMMTVVDMVMHQGTRVMSWGMMPDVGWLHTWVVGDPYSAQNHVGRHCSRMKNTTLQNAIVISFIKVIFSRMMRDFSVVVCYPQKPNTIWRTVV